MVVANGLVPLPPLAVRVIGEEPRIVKVVHESPAPQVAVVVAVEETPAPPFDISNCPATGFEVVESPQ